MDNLRLVLQMMGKVKRPMLLSLLLLTLTVVASLVIYGIQKYIIDDIFLDGHYDRLAAYMLVFALAIAAFYTCSTLAYLTLYKTQLSLAAQLSDSVMNALSRMKETAYKNERTGQLVDQVTGDVQEAARTATNVVAGVVRQVVNAVILMVIVGRSSLLLLVVMMALSVAYVALGRYFGPRMKQAALHSLQHRSSLLVRIEEGIAATREVVAFHRMGWEQARLKKTFDAYFGAVMSEGKVENRKMFAAEPLKWGITLLVLGGGGALVMNRSVSLGTFVILYHFSSQLLEANHSIYQAAVEFAAKMSSVSRVRRLLSMPERAQNGQAAEGGIEELVLDQVQVVHADRSEPALNGLSMRIGKGQKIGIVGRSGSGKSTLAHLLARTLELTAGRILVNGRPLEQIDRAAWAKQVSVLSQEPHLFPDTVRNNVLLGRDATEEQVRNACRLAQIHDDVMQLAAGYETQLGERGTSLSGGQRQRVALARAVLGRPEVLILDEATASLDPDTERRVLAALKEELPDAAVIQIAHRLDAVQDADILYVFEKGRIAEAGRHEELVAKRGAYWELWRSNGRKDALDKEEAGSHADVVDADRTI